MANPHSMYIDTYEETNHNLYCYSLYVTCDECRTQTPDSMCDHDWAQKEMYNKPRCSCNAVARYSDLDELVDGLEPILIPEAEDDVPDFGIELETDEIVHDLADILEEEATNIYDPPPGEWEL